MHLTTLFTILSTVGLSCAAIAKTNNKIPAHFRIIEDNRIHPEKGIFSFDFKTENGIVREESGNEELVRTGVISYPLPNGETFFLKFVADATGFKPESPFLPVAPVFPHPIPPHALEQIRRGEREHAEAARKRAEETNRIKRQGVKKEYLQPKPVVYQKPKLVSYQQPKPVTYQQPRPLTYQQAKLEGYQEPKRRSYQQRQFRRLRYY